jgi:hypothetical protein
MWQVVANSYWYYKEQLYRVTEIHPKKLSQDALGNWVPTVEYESELEPELRFFRPVTEFQHKFQPRDMAR